VNFVAIILCVASQRVLFIVVVYFVVDSVRKLLDIPSYDLGRFRFCARIFECRSKQIQFSCDVFFCVVKTMRWVDPLSKKPSWEYIRIYIFRIMSRNR
jgi:hypothetical protein